MQPNLGNTLYFRWLDQKRQDQARAFDQERQDSEFAARNVMASEDRKDQEQGKDEAKAREMSQQAAMLGRSQPHFADQKLEQAGQLGAGAADINQQGYERAAAAQAAKFQNAENLKRIQENSLIDRTGMQQEAENARGAATNQSMQGIAAGHDKAMLDAARMRAAVAARIAAEHQSGKTDPKKLVMDMLIKNYQGLLNEQKNHATIFDENGMSAVADKIQVARDRLSKYAQENFPEAQLPTDKPSAQQAPPAEADPDEEIMRQLEGQ